MEKERRDEIAKREKAEKNQGLTRFSKRKKKTLEEMHEDSNLVLIYDEWCRNGGNKRDAVRSVYPNATPTKCTQVWKKVEDSEYVRTLAMNRVKKRKNRIRSSDSDNEGYEENSPNYLTTII